jgi:hypothetical protein
MVAGVIQPERSEMVAMSGNCMNEIIVVQSLNMSNLAAGRNVQYLAHCENR